MAFEQIKISYIAPEQGFISANIYGDRANKTILALHGITHNALFFDFFANKAVANNFCVIAIDLPGRGSSSYFASSRNYNYKNYCDTLKLAVNELKLNNPVILGSSMGGLISMMFINENLNVTNKLILNDIGYFIPSEVLNRVGYHFRPDEIYYTPEKIRDKISKEFSQSNLRQEDLDYLCNIYTLSEKAGIRFNYDKQICEAFWRGDKQKILPDFNYKDMWQNLLAQNNNLNIYLLRGNNSSFFPAEIFYDMIKNSQVKNSHLFENVGHLPLLFREGEIDKVLEFCNA